MTPIVLQHLEELIALCRKYHVAELYLFGSAANGNFKEESSDIDLLVTFQTMTSYERYLAYFGIIEDLERLFSRSVDLVEEQAIRNPYFREEVEETRVKLYAA